MPARSHPKKKAVIDDRVLVGDWEQLETTLWL